MNKNQQRGQSSPRLSSRFTKTPVMQRCVECRKIIKGLENRVQQLTKQLANQLKRHEVAQRSTKKDLLHKLIGKQSELNESKSSLDDALKRIQKYQQQNRAFAKERMQLKAQLQEQIQSRGIKHEMQTKLQTLENSLRTAQQLFVNIVRDKTCIQEKMIKLQEEVNKFRLERIRLFRRATEEGLPGLLSILEQG